MTQQTKVLIVEDNALIAMDIDQELTDHGFVVVGRARNTATARTVMDKVAPTVVVLDMHLKGETTFDLASDLKAGGIPFLFLSGSEASSLPPELRTSKILSKPVATEQLVEAIRALADA